MGSSLPATRSILGVFRAPLMTTHVLGRGCTIFKHGLIRRFVLWLRFFLKLTDGPANRVMLR